MLYLEGTGRTLDRAWIGLARGDGAWRVALDEAGRWTPPVFPIGGKAAIAAGLTPGPALGAALARAKRAWIESDFTLDRAALSAILKR